MILDRTHEDLLRELAPQVLDFLERRHVQFDACEDALQDAWFAATTQWSSDGVPENPRGWLITVATRRLQDDWRSEGSCREPETTTALSVAAQKLFQVGPETDRPPDRDDSLKLLFLCCHPSLTLASQIALTLWAVGGLTTAQIAQAFFIPEATMAQRISCAKSRIRATGRQFDLPNPAERDDRVKHVLLVLYLIFNEGYTASCGSESHAPVLTDEARRLTRAIHRVLPDDGEVAGLLALMLLTCARRAARTNAEGSLVPLTDQNRSRWDRVSIAERITLVTEALQSGPPGPYQIRAAIAAVHAEAETSTATDWRQVLSFDGVLERIAPNPAVTLNRAVALSMVGGLAAGLELLTTLDGDDGVVNNHRLEAVRADLRERAGDRDRARAGFRKAATMTTSLPEQRHLIARAARIHDDSSARST